MEGGTGLPMRRHANFGDFVRKNPLIVAGNDKYPLKFHQSVAIRDYLQKKRRKCNKICWILKIIWNLLRFFRNFDIIRKKFCNWNWFERLGTGLMTLSLVWGLSLMVSKEPTRKNWYILARQKTLSMQARIFFQVFTAGKLILILCAILFSVSESIILSSNCCRSPLYGIKEE